MVPKNYQVMLDGSEHLWYNAEVLQRDVGWTLVRAWIELHMDNMLAMSCIPLCTDWVDGKDNLRVCKVWFNQW